MPTVKMHADEVETDAPLVRRLLEGQFPAWAALPIERVESAGTDNAIYRLGDQLAVRLPRIGWAVEQVEKEQRWLPRLAPRLPLAVPIPLALGEPGEGYLWPWSVVPWLAGENAVTAGLADPVEGARTLAAFITALEAVDQTGGPLPDPERFQRGVPLATRDAYTRQAISEQPRDIDRDAVAAAWEAALAAPAWDGAPVWVHGDLEPSNLLVVDGRLSAVIDFGAMRIGDPAVDLLPAWSLFSGAARDTFRAALDVDDATWARGRGWALSTALVALPYYQHTNPVLAANSRHKIAEVLAD